MVNKINLLRKPLLKYRYLNNGIKSKKIVLFGFGVTTCKTTNKRQEESYFTTSVPVDPDFVIQALDRANEVFERSVNSTISLGELIRRVTRDRNVDSKDLLSSKRTQEISNTRAIISYLAAIELKNSGTKIALHLMLSEKSVSRCIERGKKLLDKDGKLLDYLQ